MAEAFKNSDAYRHEEAEKEEVQAVRLKGSIASASREDYHLCLMTGSYFFSFTYSALPLR